jgi:3-methyladenine DNA glycosylase/8-oxoguanine DNA glycosylase
LRLRVETPPHFSFDGIVRSHGWYDLPPFSYDAKAGILTTAIAGQGSGVHRVAFSGGRGWLLAEADGLARGRLRAVTRRVFSLDVDLSGFRALLTGEPALRRGLSRGGGRMLRAPSLFEDAVKMLLTTNCSWEATRGMVRRLIALCGAGGEAFPEPAAVARFSAADLRAGVRCGYRAGALSLLARRVASRRLDLARWERPEAPAHEVREAILAERGFGPYAAEGLLRILGRHDYLALDSWVRKQYRRLYAGPAKNVDRSIARRYARFGRFRGLALWLEMTSPWHEA